MIVEERLCGLTIRRRLLPASIPDPHGIFRDAAEFDRLFLELVALKVSERMQQEIDEMWR